MSKSTFTLSWPVILLLIAGYNIFFDDDEDEKTDVKKETSTITIVEDKKTDVKKETSTIAEDMKELGSKIKDEVTTMITDAKKSYDESKELQPEEKQLQASPGPGPLIKSPDPEPEEELKTIEDEPEKQSEGRIL